MTELLIEDNQTKVEIDNSIKEMIKTVCDKTLEFEDCNFDAQVSVTIVDNDEIQRINKEFRDKDMPTDVLSFPMLEFDDDGNALEDDYDFDDDLVMLGDIIISAERAKKQSEEFGHSFKREMAFLTVHSMLHLLGYDHVNSDEEEKIMFGKQEEILNLLNITRD